MSRSKRKSNTTLKLSNSDLKKPANSTSASRKILFTSKQKKNFEKKLEKRKLKGKLLKKGAKTKKGYIGGKSKTTKKCIQNGGMPLVFHNLFDMISFAGSSFVNTLNGVPNAVNPLPFLGQFPI
tara:strand:+ start:259 stop:630 length:372 start_codon:yes stop_codon:yes gene_type:complete